MANYEEFSANSAGAIDEGRGEVSAPQITVNLGALALMEGLSSTALGLLSRENPSDQPRFRRRWNI